MNQMGMIICDNYLSLLTLNMNATVLLLMLLQDVQTYDKLKVLLGPLL